MRAAEFLGRWPPFGARDSGLVTDRHELGRRRGSRDNLAWSDTAFFTWMRGPFLTRSACVCTTLARVGCAPPRSRKGATPPTSAAPKSVRCVTCADTPTTAASEPSTAPEPTAVIIDFGVPERRRVVSSTAVPSSRGARAEPAQAARWRHPRAVRRPPVDPGLGHRSGRRGAPLRPPQPAGRRLTKGAARPADPVQHYHIDYLVIAPTGFYVIDTKRFRGRPSLAVEGGFIQPRVEKLMVAGRDHSMRLASRARCHATSWETQSIHGHIHPRALQRQPCLPVTQQSP